MAEKYVRASSSVVERSYHRPPMMRPMTIHLQVNAKSCRVLILGWRSYMQVRINEQEW